MRTKVPTALLFIILACQPSWSLPKAPGNGPDGLQNFYEVAPGLYRGAQPTDSQLEALKKLGVKTIVSLRNNQFQVGKEKKEVESLGMTFKHLPMNGIAPPSDSTIDKFLKIAHDSGQQPVFVHCEWGLDRTGCLIAIYREEAQQWSAKKAYDEMVSKGFEKKYPWLADAVFDYEEDKLGKMSKDRPKSVKMFDRWEWFHRPHKQKPTQAGAS